MAGMSRDRKNNGKPAAKPAATTSPPSGTPPGGALTGWKLWRFRLLAIFVVPLVLLVLAELILRAAGYGNPTHFLLPYSENGRELYVQNNQFGWRFFGPAMSRTPDAFAFPRVKPRGTIRIFVFGESAAFGDPQSAFGLPRMLEAMLELRHPGVKFEVINAAMTGINSNVIFPIAEDCAGADGDVWVVYMGNNEVVGPFGAGTVFGPQSPPVSLIRASLALKATRLGQLFDEVRRRLHPPPSSKSEWGGMEMFLDQQVRADDPRMPGVYANFARNLADIIHAGRQHGAGVVVSTVAVNLRDCAPFASAHRPGLSAVDLDKWNQLYQAGTVAQRAQVWQDASDRFHEAAAIDDSYAELRFRQGMCAAALTNAVEAQKEFVAARDLDTLRFRCDTRLNDLIRQAVPSGGDPGVTLVDAERAFAEPSPEGAPGDDLFYEHVHLTFIGNYLLAKTIAPQVDKLLPAKIVTPVPADQPWPAGQACIQRLAWNDMMFQNAITSILERFHDPPFTSQLTHDTEVLHWQAVLKNFPPLTLFPAISGGKAADSCNAAIAAFPDDARLYEQLAMVKQTTGDFTNALPPARKSVELLPSSSEDWFRLGLVLGETRQFKEAADSFQRACALDPEDVWSRCNLAQAYEHLNRRDDAIREYRQTVATKPRFGPGWLLLGKALEASGNKTEAENCYHLAVTNRVHHLEDLLPLAKFCHDHGWREDSVRIYDEAFQLNPADATIPFEAGRVLVEMATNAEATGQSQQLTAFRSLAAGHFGVAAQLNPEFMQAHYYYGSFAADPNISVHEFSEVVRLQPDLLQGHLNLGLALERVGNNAQALAQFQEVLQHDPANTLALQHVQALQAKAQTPAQ